MSSPTQSPPERRQRPGLRLSGLPDGGVPLLREMLRRGLAVRLRVTGRSMGPFMKGGEIVTIESAPAPSLRRGDLIFFTRGARSPKLHRIIRIRRGKDGRRCFVTAGDAMRDYDAVVREEEVLGRVSAVEAGGAGGKPRRLAGPRARIGASVAALVQGIRAGARRGLKRGGGESGARKGR